LAEAGLIESRLSRQDIQLSGDEDDSPFYFSPGRYVLSEFGYVICGYIFCISAMYNHHTKLLQLNFYT